MQYLGGVLLGSNPNDIPNIFNLLTGALPDITVRAGFRERERHSTRLMQTAFHELAHASHFQRLGQPYWRDVIAATITPQGSCGGYGCGGGANDGKIALVESWAEFIGTNHALRLHPGGEKISVWNGNNFIRYNNALERERWFANNWIPTGIFNDLIDVVNTDIDENLFDRTGGLTIRQLYDAFGPNVDQICEYQTEINGLYPLLGINNLNDIFVEHRYGCF